MSKIQFRNAAHRDFVLENLDKCKVNDCYHRAFFYVMGISEETRMNFGKMFDFIRDCIIPEGMHGGWQTSGMVFQKNAGKSSVHRWNCSAADMLRILWRVSS